MVLLRPLNSLQIDPVRASRSPILALAELQLSSPVASAPILPCKNNKTRRIFSFV